MKRYVDVVALPNEGQRTFEDEERSGAIKIAAYFKLLFLLCCVVPAEWRKKAFSADDRLELPSGTKRTTEERPLDYRDVLLDCIMEMNALIGWYQNKTF